MCVWVRVEGGGGGGGRGGGWGWERGGGGRVGGGLYNVNITELHNAGRGLLLIVSCPADTAVW